ncbi:hypothetical protein DFH06DRAFT_1384149 [Mycena polygramma]|nr:hypothetical protein DFH06DRAFT_1384149 [Mycena polygramma]
MPASSQSPPPTRRRSSASPSPAAGLNGVTRKVIRTLEGLGHAMEADADDEAEDEEVAAALKADRRAGKQRALEDGAEANKIDWEIPRKVFHSSIGFITLGLYITPSMSPRTVTLRCLGFLMRESERTGTNGTLWYMLGVNFALTFYPIDVATVAILIGVNDAQRAPLFAPPAIVEARATLLSSFSFPGPCVDLYLPPVCRLRGGRFLTFDGPPVLLTPISSLLSLSSLLDGSRGALQSSRFSPLVSLDGRDGGALPSAGGAAGGYLSYPSFGALPRFPFVVGEGEGRVGRRGPGELAFEES